VNDFSMRRRVGRRDVISLLRAERRSHLLLLLLLRVIKRVLIVTVSRVLISSLKRRLS
jgi:hypothetical protein